MEPGVVLQEKGRLLLWPVYGNSSLQLSQRRDVAFRVDGLSGFNEIQKDHPFLIPRDSAHHFTRWGQRLELFLLWGIHMSPLHGLPQMTPACSGDTTSRHRWWCDPGNCHLQPRIGSTGPDKLAYSVLYVPVWAFVGPTWHKLCDIPMLPPSLPMHCSQYSAPYSSLVVIRQFARKSWWCDSCAWLPGTWFVFHVAVATAETPHPPPHCANIHCLVSVNVQQASMNVTGCNFSTWRNSITHLCFIRTSMSDCPSAVICRTATKFNGILVGRFNLYCHINNIHLWHRGPTK